MTIPEVPEQSRFADDPDEVFEGDPLLPAGWRVDAPDPDDPADVAALTELLRCHEEAGRGWPSAGEEDVLVEISEHGLRTRANVVIRDTSGRIRAWGSAHDRAAGRMLLVHVVCRELSPRAADHCAEALLAWADAQAKEVGAARGLDPQQIDTGAFADDERQQRWLADAGYRHVRTWWQMSRDVTPDERDLVPDPTDWEEGGVRFRLVDREGSRLPDEADLRAVHDILEGAFTDHFNSHPETFGEFVHRLREFPGHRWAHWWLAEIVDDGDPQPVGALIGTVSESDDGPSGSYVDYIGVLSAARGRGVAKGLLRTVVADAAARGRDRVGLEVDADSPTGADGLYTSMGWETRYVTQSWHRDVPVP